MGLVTLLTLVFLAAMWIAVLAAPVLQSRGRSRHGRDSIKAFQRQRAVMQRATPAEGGRGAARRSMSRLTGGASSHDATAPAGPPAPAAGSGKTRVSAPRPPAHRVAAQRRRRVFLALAAVAVVTLVAALLNGGWFLVAHVVADLLLVAYVAAAVRVVRSAAEFEMKVAFLPHRDAGADPATLLQDVARSR